MGRIWRWLRSHYPCAIAGVAWVAYLLSMTFGIRLGSDDLGRLISMLTVSLTTWALLCVRDTRKSDLKPGQRIVSEAELEMIEGAMARAFAESLTAEPEPPQERTLRSLPGGLGA
jgi:hypothetical protein